MSDKLKPTVSVIPTYVAGESPSPEKLMVSVLQLKNLATSLEKAVGDIHSQSWPYSPFTTTMLSLGYGRNTLTEGALSGALERSLDIANIARLIGPASNLNPRNIDGEHTVTDNVPINVLQFHLTYPPKSPVTITTCVFTDLTRFANWKETPEEVNSHGDYHVSQNGFVYTYSNTGFATPPGTVTYEVAPAQYKGGSNYSGARFNTIPDPNQAAAGSGLTIATLDVNNRHLVTLPLITHQQSNRDNTSVALGVGDFNYNKQLLLPKVLTDNFKLGEQIPPGFLYLKNFTTNKVYEDATYYYVDEDSLEVANVDLDTEIGAGNVFVLFTVGTDITTSIDDLRHKLDTHSHNRENGEAPIHISQVSGLVGELVGTRFASMPSTTNGNFAPQYLHRTGYSPLDIGNNYNIMEGDFVIGRSSLNRTGVYPTGMGETFELIFGDPADALHSYIRQTEQGQLQLKPHSLSIQGIRLRSTVDVDNRINNPLGISDGLGETPLALRTLNFNIPNAEDDEVTIFASAPLNTAEIYDIRAWCKVSGELLGYWHPPNNGGTYDYTYSHYVSGGNNTIAWYFGGSGYPDGNVQVRMMIWYKPV